MAAHNFRFHLGTGAGPALHRSSAPPDQSADDPLAIELFPLLYYRGPGTSPGTGLRLVTNEDEAAVDEWIERGKTRIGVKGETKLDIGEASLVTGKTEISCNSTRFGSDE